MSLRIEPTTFFRRLNHLYLIWRDEKRAYKDADVLYFVNGKDDPDNVAVKTEALHMWLFGYKLADTLCIFTQKNLIFITGSKKIKMLEELKEEKENGFAVHLFSKNNQDNSDALKETKELLYQQFGKQALNIGLVVKEKHTGSFATECHSWLKDLEHSEIDVGQLVQDALIHKEAEELELMKNSSLLTNLFAKKLIEQVETVVDENIMIKHSALSSKIESQMDNKENAELKLLEKSTGLARDLMDLAYVPIVQSGGVYDLRPNAQSTDDLLSFDTIMCSVGAKYKEYNTNVVRTLFINADKEQKANYLILEELHDLIISKLRPGNSLKEIYDAGVKFITAKNKNLLPHLPTNFGYGIGLEFRESSLLINPKNEKPVEAGMVFNVVASLANLETTKKKNYSILIADTVVVRQSSTENLTAKIPKKYADISYELGQEAGQEEEEEAKKSDEKEVPATPATRQTRSRSWYQTSNRAVEKGATQKLLEARNKHQQQLKEEKLKYIADCIQNGTFTFETQKETTKKLEDIVAYTDHSRVPKDLAKHKISIDMKNSVLIVPINGALVPFHTSVIKSITRQDQGDCNILRVNFFVGGVNSNMKTKMPVTDNMPYIKELTFRSKAAQHFEEIIRKFKELQKKKPAKEATTAESEPLEELRIVKGKRPILTEVRIKPAISGRVTQGTFDAHLNGFRFLTKKQDTVDFTYSNIKHAFFQPCGAEMVAILHFRLKSPVLVGKKKVTDLQIYAEPGTQVEDTNLGRRARDDEDEWEAEEEEKRQRILLNKNFENFVNGVANEYKDKIEFDIPYRELGFYGVPFKSNVMLYPTLNCLISITENPPFILELDQIEWAHFERIAMNLRNFDLAFILKDYTKPVVKVDSIPTTSLEAVKNWLDKMDIPFTTSPVNVKWATLMPSVRAEIQNNPEGFIEDRGWEFLEENEQKGGNKGRDEEDEEDSEFGTEEEEVYSESDYDEDEDFEDEDESSFEPEECSDDVLDWDELDELDDEESEEPKPKRKNPAATKKVKRD